MESDQALFQNAIASIVEHNKCDREIEMCGRPQSLRAVEGTAITQNSNNGPVRLGQLHTDSCCDAPSNSPAYHSEIAVSITQRNKSQQVLCSRQSLVDNDRVLRYRLGELQHQPVRVDGHLIC